MKFFSIVGMVVSLLFLSACGTAVSSSPTGTSSSSTTTDTTTSDSWPVPDKIIALTFDDGPSTKTMVEILDLLKEYDAKGTFFLIGKKINNTTIPVLERAVEEGHELGNHSMNHLKMKTLTDEEVLSEIAECQKAVKDAVNVDMYYFRPPFGSVSDQMYDLIQMPFILGNISAGDGRINSSIAADRAWKVTSNAYDGGIAIMHCMQNNDATVEALKTILPELKAQGYEFVTLTELFTRNGGEVPVPTPGVKFEDNRPIE